MFAAGAQNAFLGRRALTRWQGQEPPTERTASDLPGLLPSCVTWRASSFPGRRKHLKDCRCLMDSAHFICILGGGRGREQQVRVHVTFTQFSHSKRLPLSWDIWWRMRLDFQLKALGHWSHLYSRSSVCTTMCCSRLHADGGHESPGACLLAHCLKPLSLPHALPHPAQR